MRIEWRYAAASRQGTAHRRRNERRQDAFRVSVQGPVLLATVADGAGSATRGGAGAALAVRTFHECLRALLTIEEQVAALADHHVWDVVDFTRDRLSSAARKNGLVPRDLATTLISVASDGETTLLVHVGDGAVVVRDRETGLWSLASAPHNGEYASTTYFLTDDPSPALRIARLDRPVSAIFTFTDGVETVVLDRARANEPFQPFFERMLAPVAAAPFGGHSMPLSAALGRYLDGDGFCSRTDDDKTLVIAATQFVCREPAAAIDQAADASIVGDIPETVNDGEPAS